MSIELLNINCMEYMATQVDAELEFIKNYSKWITAWWKPEYYRNRVDELTKDINSKNRDIEYIKLIDLL